MNKLEKLIQQYCPDGVEWKTIDSVTKSICSGLNPRKNFTLNSSGANCNYLTVKEMASGKIVFSDKTDKITKEAVSIIQNRSRLEVDDILLSGIGTIGRVAIVDIPVGDWNCSESVILLKSNQSIINPKYLKYILECTEVQGYFNSHATGSTLKGIRQKDLRSLEIPVPPLPVQEEIVRVLDTFTELQAELQAELQKRQQQYNFYRDNLLNFNRGGQEIKWMKMSDVFEIRNGYTPSKANNDFWEGGTIPWFRMEDIRQNGRILSDSISHITPKGVKGKGLFSANSFIIATTATIGEHALLIADSLANQRFTNLKIRKSLEKELSIKFFYYYLFIIDEWCKSNINLSNFASVDMVKFNNLRIPIPPLEEQNRIVSILDRFDTLTNDLTSGLPAEMEKRRQQYEYYRDRLLTFKRL